MPGYAVFDLETTGFSPRNHDRIAEIAVVLTDTHGVIETTWTTLVNPERDLGPQHVHGITAADSRLAPTFRDVAPALADLLDGRVLVAHNASFDLRFLVHEFSLAGLPVDLAPQAYLCTMNLAKTYLPDAPRGLAICCELAAVEHDGAHTALGDALATTGLLGHYLTVGGNDPQWGQAHQAAATTAWPHRPARAVELVPRGASHARSHWLTSLADRLDRVREPVEADEYLAVLDIALLDRHISVSERESLIAAALDAGLDRVAVELLHRNYLLALAHAALEDGIVTDDELGDLHVVAGQLGLDADDVEAALTAADQARVGSATSDHSAGEPNPEDAHDVVPRPGFTLSPGDQVVLTGTMTRQRVEIETDIYASGLVPARNVTKKTRLVVAADPDSLSGKARTARRYGTPVVGEPALAGLLAAVAATV